MQLNIGHKIFVHVEGKRYLVRHIATTDSEANEYMRNNPSTGLIDDDRDSGALIIANHEPERC